jgi:NTE family protein
MSTTSALQPGLGLVLSGGGARGAYQAGVVKAIAEVAASLGKPAPFRSLAGVSAGAINAAWMAAFAHDVPAGARQLADLWARLKPAQVYETSVTSLGGIGFTWARALSLGPIVGGKPPQALLDTAPLKELLGGLLPLQSLQRNVDQGVINGVAVTATDYASIHTVTFYQSAGRVTPWRRRRRDAKEVPLTVEHVMASAAIPLFFEPVAVDGSYFGDGCLRNQAPLSPAIHLGADRLIVVGVRRRPSPLDDVPQRVRPTLARILSVLLNAMFFDAVDYDVERLQTINRSLAAGMLPAVPMPAPGTKGRDTASFAGPFKPIDILTIQPSEDLGLIARDEAHHMPRVIRYLLAGMGSTEEASDLFSYLLFEGSYTQRLIDLGYKDGLAVRDQLAGFISGVPAGV